MYDAQLHMIDVSEKRATRRIAVAEGRIQLDDIAFEAVKEHRLPKGNVLALAEVAGVLAAKNASSAIPLCHPLALDYVNVSFELNQRTCSIAVLCEVGATAKTGVEMEALAGVQGALLSVYDLVKGVCPALTISDVRLIVKRGGKRGLWVHPDCSEAGHAKLIGRIVGDSEPVSLAGFRAAVLTISDRVFEKAMPDGSGDLLITFLQSSGALLVDQSVVPDEEEHIAQAVERFAHEQAVDLVITTGGTGLSPRDVTPEAVEKVCDRRVPGFGELLRSQGLIYTKFASLSRSVSGLCGRTLVISLPGSKKAVQEGLNALGPILPHALCIAKNGGGHGR